MVSGAGRGTAGVRGSGVVGRSAGGAGRYGSCCSVRVGGGMGAAGEMTGWAGVSIGAGGGTQRAAILGGSTAGSRGGRGAVILGGSTASSRGGEGGALRAGWGFSGAACRTARGAAGCDGTTGCLDGVGSRSTMARRPTAAGSVVVGFSSKSQLNGSAGVARRGMGGSARSRPAVCGCVPTALGSSGRAARAGRTTTRSPLSA